MYGHDCWYCESSVMTQQSQMFASTEWDIMLNTMTSICLIQRVCGMFDKSKLIQIIYCTYCSTNNPSQLWHCSNYCHYIEWFWRYYFLVIWVDFKGKFILILFFVCLVIGRDFGTCGFCHPEKKHRTFMLMRNHQNERKQFDLKVFDAQNVLRECPSSIRVLPMLNDVGDFISGFIMDDILLLNSCWW